jgi:short-subunit dehydrogenase
MNILITGCGSGLGKALLKFENINEIKIFPHFRNKNLQYPDALIGDINDSSFYENLSNYLEKNNIDVFINNAAVYSNINLLEAKDDEIINIINTNVVSQMLMLKRVMHHLRNKNNGVIININSLAGINPSANESIYCASKFAMKAFSKSLQFESFDTKVEFIDFFIGAMQTRMTEHRSNYDSLMKVEDVAQIIINSILNNTSARQNEIIIRKKK